MKTKPYGDMELTKDWKIQSSSLVNATGDQLSKAGYVTQDWFNTTVPSTVFNALVNAGEYRDIYFSNNLEKVNTGRFNVAWWYRNEFMVDVSDKDYNQNLIFYGLNYRANIWLNGELIANTDTTENPFRIFQMNVSSKIKRGLNALAVEVFPPKTGDLTIGFVDWNPNAPDKNMGLWRGVKLVHSGIISINNPYVRSHVDTVTLKSAKISIGTTLFNHSAYTVTVKLIATIEDINIEKEFEIRAHDQVDAKLTSDEFQQLIINEPRLWWPNGIGKPELYTLNISALVNGETLDSKSIRFGIRDISQFLNKEGHKGFKVNGKKILIKGGAWSDDLTLGENDENVRYQIEYAKHLNLNAIRMEGFWGRNEKVFDYADENGIMIMLGWSCYWEWEEYCHRPQSDFMAINPPEYKLHTQSYLDQVYWLRNHPSIFLWVQGSDKLLPTELEKMLDDSMKTADPTRPILAGCKGVENYMITKNISLISGPTGVKMRGPYDYVTPNYWSVDTAYGGAFGFNTETSPGPEVPPLESIKKMIQSDSLWPPTTYDWNFHCGKNAFHTINQFLNAFNNRYGESSTIEDFAQMSQVANYEAMRPMFEAFEVNKFKSTGVIQWMLNSAWPEMYWQLYDWYLMPNGAFYGARNACRPLNVVYNYADKSIYLTSDLIESLKNLKIEVNIFDIESKLVFSKIMVTGMESNSSKKILELPSFNKISNTYFVDLKLVNEDSTLVADNFYWLSTRDDKLDFKNSTWFVTPNSEYADLKGIRTLEKVRVESKVVFTSEGDKENAQVTLTNTSSKIAFFLELSIKGNQSGETILPVFWDDNYISLLPGETRTISAWVYTKNLNGQKPIFEISGVNLLK